MIRAILAALALIAALAPARAAGPGGTPEISISAKPVAIKGGKLNGLVLLSAVSLTASHPRFGGFSGLVINGSHLTAVSDDGWWLLAELRDEPQGLIPFWAGMAPILDENGKRLSGKSASDAEGLTVRRGEFAVSFERRHRIAFQLKDGRVGRTIRDRRFARLPGNGGLEALATTPDGWLLAIGEQPMAGQHPMYIVRWSGKVHTAGLPPVDGHAVTGADVGPDGRLYLLLRRYGPLSGVSIMIHRYRLRADGFPDAATREQLARFDGATGIDNMEGIALWQDRRGHTRLTLISDDNFSIFQRTLLVDFRVK